LPPALPQVFIPVGKSAGEAVATHEQKSGRRKEATEPQLVYEPHLLALGEVGFVNRRRNISEERHVQVLLHPESLGAAIRWEDADQVDIDLGGLTEEAPSQALFGELPKELGSPAAFKTYTRNFKTYLYREQELELYRLPALRLYGEPGETEGEFKVRAQQIAREKRDADVDKLRRKYERKLGRLEKRLAREERELEEDKVKYQGRKREELLSAGETVIGLLGIFGRRRTTGLSTAARRRRMTASAKADIVESEEEIARIQEDIDDMRRDMERDVEAVSEKWESVLEGIETYSLKPRRADVHIRMVALAWTPFWELDRSSARGTTAHLRVPAWS
jgi:hypothetical protein